MQPRPQLTIPICTQMWLNSQTSGPPESPWKKRGVSCEPRDGACCCLLHEGGPLPTLQGQAQSPFTPQPQFASARPCYRLTKQVPQGDSQQAQCPRRHRAVGCSAGTGVYGALGTDWGLYPICT